ncbi:MAG: VIT1/CCC1 transporter family protein [Treponemataceae bacterium]
MTQDTNVSNETFVSLSAQARSMILAMQTNEITEHYIYTNIARLVKDPKNKEVLLNIAKEERDHARLWAKYTGVKSRPIKFKVAWYTMLARVLGFTFVLKYMEKREAKASKNYHFLQEIPEAAQLAKDEDAHEKKLLDMLDEERLQYVGSIVLGLSDALVELTGTLAGLTFALQNNKLVALSGLITGISATLSMASSEYLSARSEGHHSPLKSCFYTGSVYLFTVVVLVLPYILLPSTAFALSLAIMLSVVVVMIFCFTYYISVAKDLCFKKHFLEMAGISLTVATISFCIGIAVKHFLGIEI